MKLISCHIENFGNIKKRDIAFNAELTSFCEKNGYGKSTIAAFLKSMFYGMDSTRKNGKFNDRVHYFPFSGGVFGGSVVFLCNDKIYKIERFFDETSDTRDKLNVYCNNVRPNDDVVDLTKLNDEIQTLQEEKQKIILNIADDERDIERYDELQNELFEQEEILNKIKREYDLLTKTVDYLNAADRIIKDKYVKPVRDIFVKYSNAIEYAFGEKVVMDPNFNVRFEQNGVERSEAYLSSGQKGVCAFCFRLALLENMYSKEKPFLILDDPFVFLDEQNHQKIKELLNSLAAYFQIIYFTCHTSRKI